MRRKMPQKQSDLGVLVDDHLNSPEKSDLWPFFTLNNRCSIPNGQFQKAESDLDYIQTTLEFEMMKRLPNGLAQEENPLVLIQQLSVVKLRYKTLCEQLEKISAERRESMRAIRATLAKTVKLVQEIQEHSGTEISSLSEEEQLAMQHLMYQTPEVIDGLTEQICPKEH